MQRVAVRPNEHPSSSRHRLRGPSLPLQYQARGVHAVTQARRLWAIIEHVAQMRATTRANDLRALHAVAAITYVLHAGGCQRLVEAGPAGTAVESRGGIKEWMPAYRANEDALALVIGVFAREGRIGPAFKGDVEQLRRKDLPPFRWGHVKLGGVRGGPVRVVGVVVSVAL